VRLTGATRRAGAQRHHAPRRRADARAADIGTPDDEEQGKPLAAEGRSRYVGRDYRVVCRRRPSVYGRVVPSRSLAVQQTVLRSPVGPVAAFTPWNFPINQVVRKLSAALATGCSMIVKAPEETPASPAALIRPSSMRACRAARSAWCSATRPRSRPT
jgi:succinate-semialdehyde dehydrogenase/glutarate-semialdehyde dehydrogenase